MSINSQQSVEAINRQHNLGTIRPYKLPTNYREIAIHSACNSYLYVVYIIADFLVPSAKLKPHNTAYLMSPEGKVEGVWQKRHLYVGVPICFDTLFTGVVRSMVREGADVMSVPNYDPEMHGALFTYLHSAFIPFRAANSPAPRSRQSPL